MLFRHCRKRNDDACCSHNSTFQFFTQLRLFVATSSNREPKWLPTKRKNWTKMGQIKNKIRTQIPYFDIRLKIFSLSLCLSFSRAVCARFIYWPYSEVVLHWIIHKMMHFPVENLRQLVCTPSSTMLCTISVLRRSHMCACMYVCIFVLAQIDQFFMQNKKKSKNKIKNRTCSKTHKIHRFYI